MKKSIKQNPTPPQKKPVESVKYRRITVTLEKRVLDAVFAESEKRAVRADTLIEEILADTLG